MVFSLGMVTVGDSECINCLSVEVAKVSQLRKEGRRVDKGWLLWLVGELESVFVFGGRTRCCRESWC